MVKGTGNADVNASLSFHGFSKLSMFRQDDRSEHFEHEGDWSFQEDSGPLLLVQEEPAIRNTLLATCRVS
jgi:hypothetical protein